MSSSKIQERNLDPNMGLAKEESVQEILSYMEQGVTANVVKSVQRGTITLSATENSKTATINAVNMDKASVNFLGVYMGTNSGNHGEGTTDYSMNFFASVMLTSNTVVTAQRVKAGGKFGLVVVFEVVEYY